MLVVKIRELHLGLGCLTNKVEMTNVVEILKRSTLQNSILLFCLVWSFDEGCDERINTTRL